VHSDHRKRRENTEYFGTALNGVNGVKSTSRQALFVF
jgi:hypothetical protein